MTLMKVVRAINGRVFVVDNENEDKNLGFILGVESEM